jgi:hypothetical protein
VLVSSRFLVGLGAWLLGTVTATTGSMIAVNELAQHLLDPQTLQLSASAINTDYDSGVNSTDPSRVPTAAPSMQRNKPVVKVNRSARSSSNVPASGSDANSAGTLLVSGDGSVMATCDSGSAYLQYWSPDQGFQADDVHRGPADAASVLFRGPANSIIMQVTCSGGTPVAHLYRPSDGGDGGDGHDGGGE